MKWLPDILAPCTPTSVVSLFPQDCTLLEDGACVTVGSTESQCPTIPGTRHQVANPVSVLLQRSWRELMEALRMAFSNLAPFLLSSIHPEKLEERK